MDADMDKQGEKGAYPLCEKLGELRANEQAKREEYRFITEVDIPVSRTEQERNGWEKKAKEVGREWRGDRDKRERFEEDYAKGIAREEQARNEGKPLDDGERAAHESQVRGFEDLEAGRKTPEGFEAGQRRLDERLDRDDRVIQDSEQKLAQDLNVGDEGAARWDWSRMEKAQADFNRTSEAERNFPKDYWTEAGTEKEGGGAGVCDSGRKEAEKDAVARETGTEAGQTTAKADENKGGKDVTGGGDYWNQRNDEKSEGNSPSKEMAPTPVKQNAMENSL